MRSIIGIGDCGYGSQIPESAVCKLRTREVGGIIQSDSEIQELGA